MLLLRRVLFINLLETAVHYFVNKDMFVLPDMLFHTAPAFFVMSPKFKRVSLNFFLGSSHCVDFDLRDSKKMENINTLLKKYFITKILIFTKLPNPIRVTRVLKLVFRTIPCVKFWALWSILLRYFETNLIFELKVNELNSGSNSSHKI